MGNAHKLSATAVKSAKASDRAYSLSDGRGLQILIKPNGSKLWRFNYRFDGKQKTMPLGNYPDVSLAEARTALQDARNQRARGIDPMQARKAAKRAQSDADTFEAVAREWHAQESSAWSAGHAERIMRRLERDVFPWIGSRPVGSVTAPELLTTLRRIVERGATETAHRAKSNCGQVFRYAVATGRAERDPSADLRGALPSVKPTSLASVKEPEAVGALLRAIDAYECHLSTRCALKLAPLVFARPGELRAAEWAEIDLDRAEWRIAVHRMKGRQTHIVPLSAQAIAILREIEPLTGRDRYVFPSTRGKGRPMSNNTLNAALRKMGYSKDEMTAHGFRSIASTLLNEQGWNPDAIERQLAHAESNSVRAAYNYAEHLAERREMMQAWADYLDRLRDGKADRVVPLRTAAG